MILRQTILGNVLQTLANIDPSLRIVQNNKMGSDPNTLPEIRLRGVSTMLTAEELKSQESGQSGITIVLYLSWMVLRLIWNVSWI